jgi:2-polyprenyl-3-methyl-5-hydroxy-6-metoxy-1,4-benzoquinol methylase
MEFTYRTELVQQLVDLAIIDLDSIELYSRSTRDDPKQTVWRCKKSGVIFLEPPGNHEKSEESDDLSYWGVEQRASFLVNSEDDDDRRFELIRASIENARYLDIGTGLGGILDKVSGIVEKVVAVEPQKAARQTLCNLNYAVFEDIAHIEDSKFDLITLFHVFEHLHNPLEMLRQIRSKMTAEGKLVIEVPHAEDALLSFYNCDEFKQFTLWSDHLVLHSKQSIQTMLVSAGFVVDSLEGHQRYDLANHQYWLSHGKPGGHNIWRSVFSQEACLEYAKSLESKGMSDTLIVVASLKNNYECK